MSSQSRKKSRLSRQQRRRRSERRLRLETLEQRNLMAADAFEHIAASAVAEGEGESRALASLADFAQALTDAGVKFYGSETCPICARQKAMFGDAADLLPYIDVTNDDGSLNEIGQQENITQFPTWDFPDGTREVGWQPLEFLSEDSGVPLPTNIVVFNTNRGLVEVELFPGDAPATVDNFLNYANDGDYDNTIFHRLVPNFVLQGGGFATTSETFTNTAQFASVPTDPPVVNEFGKSNLRATVAMAKLGGQPDSATSQFFFNLGNNSQNLDNQNGGFTVFGQVVDMASVDQMAQTDPFNLGGVFSSLPIGESSQLLVVRSMRGSGEIQGVAFEDADGDGVRDPGENAIAGLRVYVDANNNGSFDADELSATSDANGAYSIVAPSGARVVRSVLGQHEFPTTGNAGRHVVDVEIGTTSSLDVGLTTVANVGAIDLVSSSDTGASDTDNLTNLNNAAVATAIDFEVTGALPNAIVRLFAGNDQLGQATADANGVASIRTNGDVELDGQVTITADQILNTITGPRDTSLDITVDDSAPAFTTTAPTIGKVAIETSYDADTDQDAEGVTYSLENAPSGAAIDANGVFTWTPTAAQEGDHAFFLVATDDAGNITKQQMNVQVVSNEQLIIRLEATDAQGNTITEIDAGEKFFLRGFVKDNSLTPQGVAGAYIDLIYQNQLVVPTDVINFGAGFTTNQTGDIDTLGVIDELGASGNSTVVNDGELELFAVEFQANIGGVETFTGESADDLPASSSFLIGDANPLPTEVIKVESTSLTVNLSFGANGEKFGIDEDSGENNFDVLANDQRFEGSNVDLVITGSSLSSQGATIRIADDGSSIFYEPPTDFVGVDTFTYTVSDGNGTDSATVIVNVLDVNDPPNAVDDTFDLTEDDGQTLLDVVLNDSIAPDVGETLMITAVGATDNGGTVQIGGGGSFLLYTPEAHANGTETFTYTIRDNRGEEATATVTVNLAAVNDDPTAVIDNFNLDEDSGPLVFRPLDNDLISPDENETLTITSLGDYDESKATVTIVENGQAVEITPKADVHGSVFVTYTISDGNGGESTNTMLFRIASINDPPTAADDTATVTKNTADSTIDVLANDSFAPDIEEKLSITGVTGAANGTAVVNQTDDAIIYTPNADFVGEETLTYTIDDGRGGTATATVTITVRDFIPSNVKGRVFIDANKNGMQDSGETPLGGVEVRLVGVDNFGADVELTQQTDASGQYAFMGLAPGSYQVHQVQPSQFINGSATVGSQGGAMLDPNTLSFELAENVDGQANNFAEWGRAVQFVRLNDFFLRPTMPQAEVFENGNGQQSFTLGDGWDDVTDIVLTSPDNGNGEAVLQLRYFDTTQTVNVPLSKIETRTNGSQVYRRIQTSVAELGVQLNGGTAQGEGERQLIATAPPLTQPVIESRPREVINTASASTNTGEGESSPIRTLDVTPLSTAATERTRHIATDATRHGQIVSQAREAMLQDWPLADSAADDQAVDSFASTQTADEDVYAEAVDLLLGLEEE